MAISGTNKGSEQKSPKVNNTGVSRMVCDGDMQTKQKTNTKLKIIDFISIQYKAFSRKLSKYYKKQYPEFTLLNLKLF